MILHYIDKKNIIKYIYFMRKYILLMFLFVLFTISISLMAKPNLWISTSFDMNLNDGLLSQWRIEQSINIPLSSIFSLSGLFGYSSYYDTDFGYKIMLGGTLIFPKNWYIDFMYGFFFHEIILRHEIFLSLNFEKNNWYLAFRQIFKFNENFFSEISYIYSIYFFPNGYTFSVNSAIGFESGKEISYAIWVKSYLAFFPFLGPEIGASFAVEQNLFNWSILLGLKINLPIFSISAYWQPYFANKSGESDIGFALIVKL